MSVSSVGKVLLVSSDSTEELRLRAIEREYTRTGGVHYFKASYTPYVNFAIGYQRTEFKGRSDWGERIRAVLTDNGDLDLITKSYLVVKLPAFTYTNSNGVTLPFDSTRGSVGNPVGLTLFEYAELEIDNQIIDTKYSLWLDIWSELTNPNVTSAYDELIGKSTTNALALGNAEYANTYIIPLGHWFSQQYSVVLPMMSLYRCNVAINIKLRKFEDVYTLATGVTIPPNRVSISEVYLLNETVYLDSKEREKWKNAELSYIVDTVQYNNGQEIHPDVSTTRVAIPFTGVCKGFYWTVQEKSRTVSPANDYFNYRRLDQTGLFTLSVTEQKFIDEARIILNGNELTTYLPEKFYRLQQTMVRQLKAPLKNVYAYTFALNPSQYQRTGSFNMNTINDSNMYLELKLTPKPKKITLDPVTGAVLTDQTYASRELVCQLFGIVTNVCTIRNGVCYFEMQH